MDTVIYFLLSLAYFILLVIGVKLACKHGWFKIGNVLLIVIIALLYDNGILALRKYVGKGATLKLLNELRYWFHAFSPLYLSSMRG